MTADDGICTNKGTVGGLPMSPIVPASFTTHFDRPRPVLHTTHKMSRRLGILLLLVAVSFSAATTCPRRVAACSMVRQATHDCCTQRTSLGSNDCCCKASDQLTAQAINTVPQDRHASVTLVAAVSHLVFSPTAITQGICTRAPLGHGADPPDTPVTRHTQLLL